MLLEIRDGPHAGQLLMLELWEGQELTHGDSVAFGDEMYQFDEHNGELWLSGTVPVVRSVGSG